MTRSSALACLLLLACSKSEPPPSVQSPASAPSAPARAVTAVAEPLKLEDTSFRYPAAERIVAIGDIHGDVAAAKTALRLGGAIDAADKWIGGKLVVVQTGDQLDRGDDEPQILDLFERLAAEANAAGGAVYALNGNHEIMNVQGDYRYVTEDGFHDYAGAHADGARAQLLARAPAEQRGRAAAFLPGGDVARRLAHHLVVLQVGDNVFVHGGVLEPHVRYGLARINHEVEAWMNGAPDAPAPSSVSGEQSLIWSRAYSDGIPYAGKCDELARVLTLLSAKRLIVGHTVQKQGITGACAGKVWRIDVGLSRYYGGKPSVLEIRGDEVKALAEP